MEPVRFRLPKTQLDKIDQMVEEGEFPNRSEAIRQAIREVDW
jgi:antitoxin ParD1/3/4